MVKFQDLVSWLKLAMVAVFIPWKSANAIPPARPNQLLKMQQHTCLPPSTLCWPHTPRRGLEKELAPSLCTCEAAVPSHPDIEKCGGNERFGHLSDLGYWQEGSP